MSRYSEGMGAGAAHKEDVGGGGVSISEEVSRYSEGMGAGSAHEEEVDVLELLLL